MAYWDGNWYIIGSLIVLMLGHWALILQAVILKATWMPDAGCVLTETNNTILAATFIYSMSFDFIVMVLSVYQLYQLGKSFLFLWR